MLWTVGALLGLDGTVAAAESRIPPGSTIARNSGSPADVRPASAGNIEPRFAAPRNKFMTERKPRAPAQDGTSSTKAIKVPGGWKLPGDDTVYPYDPLVPPDMVDPLPLPQGHRPTGRKTGK